MIFIGLGANLPSKRFGSPQETLKGTFGLFAESGVAVTACSRWYESAPVPPSGQPWFVNGVARVATSLSPMVLLTLLHRLEAACGRVREAVNAARPLDLDLLDYEGRVSHPGEWPILPHPSITERAFVLFPLQDVAPAWRHPLSGRGIDELIAALPPGQLCRPLAESGA